MSSLSYMLDAPAMLIWCSVIRSNGRFKRFECGQYCMVVENKRRSKKWLSTLRCRSVCLGDRL